MPKDHETSFKTHKNYLRAFAHVAGFTLDRNNDEVMADIRTRFSGLAAYTALQKSASPHLDQVQASLANAWGTELLVWLGSRVATETELAGLTNNWGVVQSYYTMYQATQALAAAGGSPQPDSHPKTQKMFGTHWVSSSLRLAPWSLAFASNGSLNFPSDKNVDHAVSNLASCTDETCWSLCAKVLRTTREKQLPDAHQKARQRKKKAKRDAWLQEEQQRVARGAQGAGRASIQASASNAS